MRGLGQQQGAREPRLRPASTVKYNWKGFLSRSVCYAGQSVSRYANTMRSTLVLCAFLAVLCATAHALPNYITEEEFAAARANPIIVQNGTVLPLPRIEDSQAVHPRPGFGPRLWTNAQVPYTLDPTFNAQQREDVARAIDAYHRDTCIRFVPKTAQHGSWVDILHDPTVCGVAHVCMNTGAQFAKFGGSCVNPGTMVHELGHTLCMGHEQTRRDRDNWIGFNTAICEPHGLDGPDFNRGLHKMYDYVSIEHYEGECYNGCFQPKKPGVTKCGSGGPLAVLDLEVLNELYGCGGCHAYRYLNPANVQLVNPVRTGTDVNFEPLYTCRTYHRGDIIPGKYNLNTRECHVAHGGGEHRYTTDIEVLCNPSNLNLGFAQSGTPPANAIKGGRTNERETLYNIRCTYGNAILPGKYQPSAGAYTSYAGQEMRCSEYEFVVCNSSS